MGIIISGYWLFTDLNKCPLLKSISLSGSALWKFYYLGEIVQLLSSFTGQWFFLSLCWCMEFWKSFDEFGRQLWCHNTQLDIVKKQNKYSRLSIICILYDFIFEIQIYFKISDYTHSGCTIDQRSVQIHTGGKAKMSTGKYLKHLHLSLNHKCLYFY